MKTEMVSLRDPNWSIGAKALLFPAGHLSTIFGTRSILELSCWMDSSPSSLTFLIFVQGK